MKKLFLLFSVFTFSFVNAQTINFSQFCVLSIGNLDTLANTIDVAIYNGDSNQVNYPTIIVVDAVGDTIANKNGVFTYFADTPHDTLTQSIPCDLDSLPAGFTGTVYYTDQVWDTTGIFPYPMPCTAGFSEYVSAVQFNIYPNPASDRVNIELSKGKSSPAEISLYDMTGKKVRFIHTQEPLVSIPREDLSNGIYFVEVIIDGKRQTGKLILN